MNEDKATRYHRLRRRASLIGTGLSALLLLVLVVSGASAYLRTFAASLVHDSFSLTVVLYVILLTVAFELVQVPLSFYLGVTLERRYGLSTQTTARWWLDHAKAAAIGLSFALAGALLVAWMIRWNPERWWLVAAAAFSAVMIVLAQLAPVLLLPVFYEFKPLDRPALRD